MQSGAKYLKRCLVAGVAVISIQPASGQTILDVLDLVLDLDTNVTLLGQNVVGLGANVSLQAGLIADLDTRVITNTTNIANIQVDLGTIDARVTVNTGDILNLQTGLAGNDLRDDAQDLDISGLTAGLAANTAHDGVQDTRLDYNEATLLQHDVRIAEARQIGVNAAADAAAVRSDVEAGRVGIVRTEADGNFSVGSAMGGTSVSFAGTAGDRRLIGVANGIAPNDAATVDQLQTSAAMTLAAAQDYTDGKLVGINNSFLARISQNNQELRTEINAAAASTAALAGLPQAFVPGKGMIAMGVGGKGDQAAIAFGIGKAFNHPAVPVIRAGAAVNTANGQVTYNAAVGIHF